MSNVWESFRLIFSHTPPLIMPTKYLFIILINVTCIFEQNFVHIRAGVLEQFVVGVEDDDGDLAVAEDGQLVGLLHQTKFPLCERHLGRIN